MIVVGMVACKTQLRGVPNDISDKNLYSVGRITCRNVADAPRGVSVSTLLYEGRFLATSADKRDKY